MGFFNKKASAKAVSPADVKSEATTTAPSKDVPHTESEKETQTSTVSADKTPDASSVSSLEKDTLPVTTESTSQPRSTLNEKEREDEKKVVEGEAEDGDHDGEDEAVYPSGLKLVIIVIALCLSVFLVALDNTIIATAIPKITDRFNSLGDVGWYASSYLLTTCALQLFFGKSVSIIFTLSTPSY